MKKLIFAIFCVFLSLFGSAQNPDYTTVFEYKQGEKIKPKFYGALLFEHQSLITNTKPGLEIGFLFNNAFFAGIYGMGTSGNFATQINGMLSNNMFGESGVVLSYAIASNKPCHLGGSFRLGYVSVVGDDEEIKLFDDLSERNVVEDNGFTFHPEIFGELNLSKYAKIRLGVGYSFYSFADEKPICNKTIDSWTMNLGIVFGNFAK